MATTAPASAALSITFNTSAKFIEFITRSGPEDCFFKFPNNETKIFDEIAAHRQLLAVLSPVFATMFDAKWAEGSKENVITDASSEAFREFLKYFYKGRVKLSTDNIHEITHLADKYFIEELAASCTSFAMKYTSAENVLQFFEMAILYGSEKLRKKCIGVISKNTAQVLASDEFMQCSLGMLRTILEIPEMSSRESAIFDACIEWAKHMCRSKKIDDAQPSNLRAQLGDCFELIRFVEMDRDELMQRYDEYRGIFSSDEIEQIFSRFIRMGGAEMNTRFTIFGETAGGIVDFLVAEGFQNQSRTQVLFNLSQTVMLTGISFPTPQTNGVYIGVEVIVEVQLANTRMPTFHGRTLTLQESCIMLPQPLLIPQTKSCFITITLKAEISQLTGIKWQRWDSMQLTPASSWLATEGVKSFILTLRHG